jgi:hypothetical protein
VGRAEDEEKKTREPSKRRNTAMFRSQAWCLQVFYANRLTPCSSNDASDLSFAGNSSVVREIARPLKFEAEFSDASRSFRDARYLRLSLTKAAFRQRPLEIVARGRARQEGAKV